MSSAQLKAAPPGAKGVRVHEFVNKILTTWSPLQPEPYNPKPFLNSLPSHSAECYKSLPGPCKPVVAIPEKRCNLCRKTEEPGDQRLGFAPAAGLAAQLVSRRLVKVYSVGIQELMLMRVTQGSVYWN